MSLAFVLNNIEYSNNALQVNYSTNSNIVISNTLPMTDEVGKVISFESSKPGTTGYLEFEIKSNGANKYEVYLTRSELNNEVPWKFVKVYLTDDNDVAYDDFEQGSVPTYYDLMVSDSDPSGKLLFSETLKGNKSKKFKLRMWVADTYELTPDIKTFSVKLNVKVK